MLFDVSNFRFSFAAFLVLLGVFFFSLLLGVNFGLGGTFELFLLVGGFTNVFVIFNGLLVVGVVVPGRFLCHGLNAVPLIVDI